ncbi:MAG: hypothetical protein ACETWG_03075 [Candidatus Neomarinimicrobiota bacterium]
MNYRSRDSLLAICRSRVIESIDRLERYTAEQEYFNISGQFHQPDGRQTA